MPSHWTFAPFKPDDDLQQGDLVRRSEALLTVLSDVHKFFCDERYIAFAVLTQSCDLVRRRGQCKAEHVQLAVVRELEPLLPRILAEPCGVGVPCVYKRESRYDAQKIVQKIVNQNDQARGLFYLHPDADAGIATPSVVMLRVSIALRREHYDMLLESRCGRLLAEYANKLGWLSGNLYSRVATPDWEDKEGDKDASGKLAKEYQTGDFERVVALRARTKCIAKAITDFMKRTDRFAKTIVFCVDQPHADEMRRELSNLNSDLVAKRPNYVCRVTADERAVGRGHLSDFQDVESTSPVILTTSQLLTTGVDVPTCQNVVLARVVNSTVEFKQIIGRGTRLRDDYGKYFFNIIDFTQSTRLFADPEFDGDPALITEFPVDDEGERAGEETIVQPEDQSADEEDETIYYDLDERDGESDSIGVAEGRGREKYYFDGGHVEVATHLVYELDPDGNQLRVVKYTDYTAEKVRSLYRNSAELRKRWADPDGRSDIIEALAERGIQFDHLAEASQQPDADPFDLLCHVAFNAPLRTRRERADRLRTEQRLGTASVST